MDKIDQIDNIDIINKFRELNIIMELEMNLIFNKRDRIYYKIGEFCNYNICSKKTILAINCKCMNTFYCSYKCRNNDKNNNIINCKYLM